MPLLMNTSSNTVVHFGVPVADQEPELPGPLPHLQHQVAGLLSHPLPARMGRPAEDVHPPGRDLHQELTSAQPPTRSWSLH